LTSSSPVLDVGDVATDPIVQFQRWFADAVSAGEFEPEAMCVATAVDNRPSARMVLMKAVDQRGFVFYTNYESQKASELAANPSAALVFRWTILRRQVRVTGRAEWVSEAESDAYFASRERGSQLGAWASQQSTVLPDRATLDRRMAEVEARFADQPVPRPPWWGGIRVVPDSVELWQGQVNRLHDRLRYTPTDDGWRVERLAP
jgi:pyridoxamine 5'-phosphate oxidase